jgi:hypothetical protein
VCGPVDPASWRDGVGELIGIYPPDVGPNDMDKKRSHVHSSWQIANFHTCPKGANDVVVQRYTHARLWHMIAGFRFSDRSGNTISWLVLPILHLERDLIATYSWRSATLCCSITRCAMVATEPRRTPTLEVVPTFYNFGCGSDFLSADQTGVYLRHDLFSATFFMQ